MRVLATAVLLLSCVCVDAFLAPACAPLARARSQVSHRRPLPLTAARGMRMEDLELTDAGRRELRDLEGKWKNICVLGGSKGVGRDIVNILANLDGVNVRQEQGIDLTVVCLVRSEEAKSELEGLDGVKAVMGDAAVAGDVIGVLDGCDAAISTLGGVTDGARIDYKGNMNMIENAGILGVTRMILVTSIGSGDSKDALPETAYEALKEALVDKTKAENLLLKYYTNSDYTIIRPGGLKTAPASGKGILTADKMASGAIHREDVAKLCVDALYSKKCSQKVLSAVDPSLSDPPSSYEAFEL